MKWPDLGLEPDAFSARRVLGTTSTLGRSTTLLIWTFAMWAFLWELEGSPLELKEYQISPADFGLASHPLEEVSGGTVEERVAKFHEVVDHN